MYPLVAVAEALLAAATTEKIDIKLYYMGPRSTYDTLFVDRGIEVRGIAGSKYRRYFSLTNVVDVVFFAVGIFQALWKILFLMPDAIFSKGGPGALPVVLVGWLFRIPILIHESDTVPGLTNAISSTCARKIIVAFEEAATMFPASKVRWIGSPVLPALLAGHMNSSLAKEKLDFSPTEKLTVVLGGSQGSVRINEFILKSIKELLMESQILHQTGEANYKESHAMAEFALSGFPSAARYKDVPYLGDDMAVALSAADLVIARAGSGTIAELAAFGKASVLIPLFESANDHQRKNAYAYARNGAAIVVEENNISEGILVEIMRDLFSPKSARLKQMETSARGFFIPNAHVKIAEEILSIVGNNV